MKVSPFLLGMLALPLAAHASNNDDVNTLRAELNALRSSYESRLQQLEQRLAAAEAKPAPIAAAAPAAVAAPAPAAPAATGGPDVSLILSGRYSAQKDLAERYISGFMPAGDHAHGASSRGFSLDESELVLTANVDPYWQARGYITFADGEAQVEEAWFQSLQLGQGLTVKGGRFLSGIGYLNEMHPHAWDFADTSMMYKALFGSHYIQDGVQLKWLAPTDRFFEIGTEVGSGRNFPGTSQPGAGSLALFAHVGDDVGASNSWRAGLSYLQARPHSRESMTEDLNEVEATTAFSGHSKTWLADFVWKWAPQGNMNNRYFKLQGEYFTRHEDGQLYCADNTADGGSCAGLTDSYSSRQSGWYVQGVYQFMPRWRVGLRQDQLDSGSTSLAGNQAYLPAVDYRPRKTSIMLDYSPSEFSRIRLQWAQDKSMQAITDNQLILQYIMSLGAHGAHAY